MTDRNQVIDWLETALHSYVGDARARITMAALRRTLALLKEPILGFWISVKDRQPETTGTKYRVTIWFPRMKRYGYDVYCDDLGLG